MTALDPTSAMVNVLREAWRAIRDIDPTVTHVELNEQPVRHGAAEVFTSTSDEVEVEIFRPMHRKVTTP